MLANLLPLILLASCHKVTSEPPHAPSDDEGARHAAIVAELPRFLVDGWVVSWNGVYPDQTGDSLLFSGLAMYGLSCRDGSSTADAMETMLNSGAPYRYPGLGAPVSMDGWLGLYRGLLARSIKCNEVGRWSVALNRAPKPDFPAGFNYVRDGVLHAFDLAKEPSALDQGILEATTASWAELVKKDRAACFRIHISLLALQDIEGWGGKVSQSGKNAFCAATSGTDIPTVDSYCGRAPLSTFLDSFVNNQWVYRHQRCGGWEAPDGAPSEHPGIDEIVAYRDMVP